MELTLKIKAQKIEDRIEVSVALIEETDNDVFAHHQHQSLPAKDFSQTEYQSTLEEMIRKCIGKCHA